MSTVDTAVVAIGIMFVVTNFQGVRKGNEMVKFDIGRVIVKTVNWSSWCVLATLGLTFSMYYIGQQATGHLLGIALGLYLLGVMVNAIMAWINDNPFKKLSESTNQNPKANTDQQVVVERIKA